MAISRLFAATALTALALGATGCGQASPSSGPTAPSAKSGKFDQTWAKSYDKTTCADWVNRMSQQENFAAAADMLLGAQRVDNKNVGLPSDKLINEFKGGITTACVEPSMRITEIAVGVYLTEKATFKP